MCSPPGANNFDQEKDVKDQAPESWIDLRRMPPGRRQWAFRQVGGRLAESDTELRALCDAGAAAEAEQLALMLRFKGDQSAKDPTRVWPRAVVDLDAALDRQVGHFQDFVRSMIGVFDGKPRGELWQRLSRATFPAGASYYTSQPYVEEAARVKTLLDELAKPDWAELTGEAIVRETLTALAETHGRYAGEVAKFDQLDKVSWDKVKELDLANHRRLCVLVATIVARHAADGDVRARLLAPIAQQDQQVYEALRERRRVLDVDPATGDPIAPVVSPTPESPPV